MDEQLDIQSLYSIGFSLAARWVASGDYLDYEFEPDRAHEVAPLFRLEHALYSFCQGNEVLYIGKTARSLARRFTGYCKPGQSQTTNKRCHSNIKACIGRGETISILVFTPIASLQYEGFGINLAAGLEDALISRFDPPWNGRPLGHSISESAEIENDVIPARETTLAEPTAIGQFQVVLQNTYYNQGIINPGVQASQLLGAHNTKFVVHFDDETASVSTQINRHANRNGSVRLIGGNREISDWFKKNFQLNDVVKVRILGANEIELMRKHQVNPQ